MPRPDLTTTQAARELGISPRAVIHRIVTGKLKAEKHGDGETSPYVIPRTEIDRVLAAEAQRQPA